MYIQSSIDIYVHYVNRCSFYRMGNSKWTEILRTQLRMLWVCIHYHLIISLRIYMVTHVTQVTQVKNTHVRIEWHAANIKISTYFVYHLCQFKMNRNIAPTANITVQVYHLPFTYFLKICKTVIWTTHAHVPNDTYFYTNYLYMKLFIIGWCVL